MSQVVKTEQEEMKQKLLDLVKKHKGEKGALIPVLHEAQQLYGYLPIEVQETIAEELDIPLTEVYGVATFYSQFTLKPKGKYKIGVCLGTACYVRGSQQIVDRLCEELGIAIGETTEDGKFTVEATRCVGACGLAPVLMVNEDVYGRLVEDDIPKILEKY
ncbi:NADH-quinone oxidoreductase subunit NuoE [Irregularibacter muris]|uniref:NADH-quinone oxidoreductase subunit NuoE n=1 Tax=Irregularibacter muris TaxID=1796619 RepID=A0AAE3L4C8_9FIRM|nr:NADH-quinone oxidoreductase subunit NuoE [Irregularibacter muris]MCR1899883.1 NADH-quinone oxidoreductase subunit NuoE [Irregularibacter muris]